jgi:acetoin utilization deacetylase AcuC-like enzyme
MKLVYSEKQTLHNPELELYDGRMTPYFEKPERTKFILDAFLNRELGDVIAPTAFSIDFVSRIHSQRYVDFLGRVYEQWKDEGREGDAFGFAFNSLNVFIAREPVSIHGQLGMYTGDGGVPISSGTWEAVRDSAFTALTAQTLIANGERSAFALCRPPGHHAGREVAGGYCYINNAAVAAQALLNDSAKRIAILDIDYHHGNGTQSIFYDRSDVLFLSIHADPLHEYPYYTGHADERGAGKGEGFNVNYSLPLGTDFWAWGAALDDSIAKIRHYAPDVLVISLGVDTFKNDPISKFKLESVDYLTIGARLAKLGLPTLFVMEGGYAIEEIGTNATNVLSGYLGGS